MEKEQRVKIIICILFVCFCIPFCCFSQEIQDTIYLKNGQIITGKIIGKYPDKSLKIRTTKDEVYIFPFSEILNTDTTNNLPEINYQSQKETLQKTQTTQLSTFTQVPIDVTNQTFKLGGKQEKELYFGFASGDEVVFNFRETNNKELKEIEILEYPDNSRFSDFKAQSIVNKKIRANKQGIYVFRFKNSSLAGRVCKIKIQRIPAIEETVNFDTSVRWENRQETTYNTYTKNVITGYDTAYIQKIKMVFVKSELSEEMILEKTDEELNSTMSMTNPNQNTRIYSITLPQNKVSDNFTKDIVAWAYWIGVGNESKQAWNKNIDMTKNIAKTVSHFIPSSPLAGYAIGIVGELAKSTGSEVVEYYIEESSDFNFGNMQRKTFGNGNGNTAYGKNSDFLQGKFTISLRNNNKMRKQYDVRVVVIWETNYYEPQPYIEMKVTPRYEKKVFSDPIIKTNKVPIIGQ